MKTNNIQKALRAKLENWAESIEDEEVRYTALRNVIVTGGAITSMLMSEDVNDYDLYFRTYDATLAVADYYAKKIAATFDTLRNLRAWGDGERVGLPLVSVDVSEAMKYPAPPDGEKLPKYRPRFFTPNAVTLSDDIQIVTRFYGEPSEIHLNYDYVHCTCSYDYRNDKLDLPHAALVAILAKELKYVGSRYPVCSMIRMRKFIQRGWQISAGQIVKMAYDVAALDLTNVSVLQEQLVGVDATYFLDLIARMNEEGRTTVDRARIIELIDQVFG